MTSLLVWVLHPHTFSETLFSFQSTTSVWLNQTAFIFYQISNPLSRTFFDLFFRRLGSRLTTFKYITRFALTLQVFFSKTFLKLSSSSSSLKTTLLIYPTFSFLANPSFVRVIHETHGCVVTQLLFYTFLFNSFLFILVLYYRFSLQLPNFICKTLFQFFVKIFNTTLKLQQHWQIIFQFHAFIFLTTLIAKFPQYLALQLSNSKISVRKLCR